jgi:hypothetical protein
MNTRREVSLVALCRFLATVLKSLTLSVEGKEKKEKQR